MSLVCFIWKSKLVKSSPSGSFAITVPIVVSFSFTANVSEDVISGRLSLRLIKLIWNSFDVSFKESETVIVMKYWLCSS